MKTPFVIPLLTALTASALGAVACGDPCMPTITADTLIAPALIDCEADMSTGSGGTSDASTAVDTTGSGDASSTTGDPVTPIGPKPDPLPVCIAIPVAGEEWGPCVNGECAAGLFCKVSGMGDVCLAACDVPGPCSAEKCLGGTCDMDIGACAPPCEAVGDPCPLPGMQCDFNGGAPLCVHTL